MSFHEIVHNIVATTTNQMLPPLESYKDSTKTIFIKNNSTSNIAEVQLVISPNGTDWVEESRFRVVKPGETIFMIQGILAKYFTIIYRSQGGIVKLTIWFDYATEEQCVVKGKNVYMKCNTCQVNKTKKDCWDWHGCCNNLAHCYPCSNQHSCNSKSYCDSVQDNMEFGVPDWEIDVSKGLSIKKGNKKIHLTYWKYNLNPFLKSTTIFK